LFSKVNIPLSLSPDTHVGILGGTGNEGRALALRFAASGWSVSIGSRDRTRAAQTASEIAQSVPGADVHGLTNNDVAGRGGLVFLCVPYDNAAATLHGCRELWRPDSVVVDTTVPLVFDRQRGAILQTVEGNSGSEVLARELPEGIPLVAAFKTIPAHILGDVHEPLDCDVIVCSDHPEAKARVMKAAMRFNGLRAVDGGPLRHARALEAMCCLVIGINRRHKAKGGRFRVVGL
jgi:NADPH-dependent F420 reductase